MTISIFVPIFVPDVPYPDKCAKCATIKTKDVIVKKPTYGKYDKVSKNFWGNIGFILKEQGRSWKWLAGELDVDSRTLSSRKSAHSNVSVGNAKEIAEILGTSIDQLVSGRDERM